MALLLTKKFGGIEIKGPSLGGLSVKNIFGESIFRVDPGTEITRIKNLVFDGLLQSTNSTKIATFNDSLLIEHINDRTAKIKFDLSAVSSGTTRTLIMPDSDVVLGAGGGGGGAVGPPTTTVDSIVRWNSTTGILLQDSLNIIMDDNGEIIFTEATNATKGIIFPTALTDSFHFKDSGGSSLLIFNTSANIPQFPNSLELNNASSNIIFPDNQSAGLRIKSALDTYIQFDSTNSSENVQIAQDTKFTQGVSYAVVTININTTLDSSHFLVRCSTSGGSITITLPPKASHVGRQYKIIKIDAVNTLFIDPFASELIDGSSVTINLKSMFTHITLICDGISGWFTM